MNAVGLQAIQKCSQQGTCEKLFAIDSFINHFSVLHIAFKESTAIALS